MATNSKHDGGRAVRLLQRALGVPLMVEPRKLEVILGVLGRPAVLAGEHDYQDGEEDKKKIPPAPMDSGDTEAQAEPLEVQTVICSKEKFPDQRDATKWVKDHGFRADKVDETEDSWRYRQFDPGECRVGSFRTFRLADGVQAVGCRKGDGAEGKDEEKKHKEKMAALAAQSMAHREREGMPLEVSGGVAVVHVCGTLVSKGMGSRMNALSGLLPYADIRADLDEAAARGDVRSILLHVDSPGGEVNGVFELADRIREVDASKPVVAAVDAQATSAAYLLASAAREVVVARDAVLGSIGVVLAREDTTRAMEMAGVVIHNIHAGARKVDQAPTEPMSDGARAALQALVDKYYGMLVSAVSSFRGLPEEAVRGTEAGLFVGDDGVAARLADRVDTLQGTLDRLSGAVHTDAQMSRGEDPMSTPAASDPTKPEQNPAALSGADMGKARDEGYAQAAQVVQACQLAGKPEMAAQFIEQKLTAKQATEKLLALRVEEENAGGAVDTKIEAAAGTKPAAFKPGAGPVVAAAEKIAERMRKQGFRDGDGHLTGN